MAEMKMGNGLRAAALGFFLATAALCMAVDGGRPRLLLADQPTTRKVASAGCYPSGFVLPLVVFFVATEFESCG